MKKKILKWLGMEKYTPFEKKFFEDSIFHAVIYMAVLVVVLEIYVISSVTLNVLTSGKPRTMEWIISHYTSYVVLLISGTIMLAYALRYIKGKTANIKLGYGILVFFCGACLLFGIYISTMDYAKGEQILTFLTMETFVFCLLVWRPIVSISLLILSFCVFMYCMNMMIPLSFASLLNMSTYLMAILMVSISAYRQRMQDAKINEYLKDAYNDLELTSVTDYLTGVYNYSAFCNKSEELLDSDWENLSAYTFFFLNILDFKAFNEKNGYEMGDILLGNFALHLKSIFSDELVGRVSDDHFVLLTKREDALDILKDLDRDLLWEHAKGSLGLACGAYHPEGPDCDAARACDYARYACATIKKQFSTRYALYDHEMDQQFKRRQYIVNHVDEAIENGYVQPYYQPVMLSKDFTLNGTEALARWIDPVYGFLSPGDFVPVLEEYRLVHKLDLAIMRQVICGLRKLLDEGKPCFPVSINFSRLDFSYVNILEELEAAVTKYDVPKELLHVEVTESALTENDNILRDTISSLKKAGYAVWLDDFGSGYSALNVLKDYHFDVMKIDLVFLRNFDGNQRAKDLIKSIVELAGVMEMDTLTEGVETLEQAEFLREIGCTRLQGYYFGKPMPMDELQEKIASGKLKTA